MTGKKIALLQSSYIPWKGYFDLIASVDEFILYDDAQYTKNDWRNRNLIKAPQGMQWLTIPVHASLALSIKDVKVADNRWAHKHWNALKLYYAKAPYFDLMKEYFEDLYHECANLSLLSEINYKFIVMICRILNIKTKISWSMDYVDVNFLEKNKTEKILAICQAAQADVYFSGPSAKTYIDVDLFKELHIALNYIDYSNYPMYNQLYGEFEHAVSILDLIFNVGSNAISYMKSGKNL